MPHSKFLVHWTGQKFEARQMMRKETNAQTV